MCAKLNATDWDSIEYHTSLNWSERSGPMKNTKEQIINMWTYKVYVPHLFICGIWVCL